MRLDRLLVETPDRQPRVGDLFRVEGALYSWRIIRVSDRGIAHLNGHLASVIFVICEVDSIDARLERYSLWAFEFVQGIGNREVLDMDSPHMMFLFNEDYAIITPRFGYVATAFSVAIQGSSESYISKSYRSFPVEWLR
jgi:hypothetical protein